MVMGDVQNLEILLVEDSDHDAEMTVRTLRKRGIANPTYFASSASRSERHAA